jgi:8-oxo-dGTP pyrophosphatase MutT (NUDIX family)
VKNLSPSADRIARIAFCIFKEGQILMVESEHSTSGWSLPGGGVNPGETLEQAAVREAWEEAGAVVELGQLMLEYTSWSGHPGYFFIAHLIRLEPSLEGRKIKWIDISDPKWHENQQIKTVLEQLHRPSV